MYCTYLVDREVSVSIIARRLTQLRPFESVVDISSQIALEHSRGRLLPKPFRPLIVMVVPLPQLPMVKRKLGERQRVFGDEARYYAAPWLIMQFICSYTKQKSSLYAPRHFEISKDIASSAICDPSIRLATCIIEKIAGWYKTSGRVRKVSFRVS